MKKNSAGLNCPKKNNKIGHADYRQIPTITIPFYLNDGVGVFEKRILV